MTIFFTTGGGSFLDVDWGSDLKVEELTIYFLNKGFNPSSPPHLQACLNFSLPNI